MLSAQLFPYLTKIKPKDSRPLEKKKKKKIFNPFAATFCKSVFIAIQEITFYKTPDVITRKNLGKILKQHQNIINE